MSSPTNPNSVGEIVRKAEGDYVSGKTSISKYVEFSLYETIEKIYAYANSKFEGGEKDSKGRDKPFFNIVTAAENIWYRATDIDRKNIRFRPTKSAQRTAAYLATFKLRDWMRRHNFGVFLNEWGRTLARYGSALLKFVEKDGQLISTVVPWNTLVVDSVDVENNVIIEKLELTPAQLRKRTEYDQETVKNLIAALAPRKTAEGMDKDSKADYVKLYEVHGEMPLSYLTDNEDDEETYVQQMHVVSFVARKDSASTGYDDFTLYRGREKNPYMMTHLIKEDGRAIGKGAVENLFEAQWMVNHSMKNIKDQLDLASKLVFQTADSNFVSRNVLKAVETGDILVHRENMPLTHIANNANDITSLQNFAGQWRALGQEINATPDVMMGKNMPSGTAYRQAAIIQQESHSNFEIMTENKALALEDICRKFVIPWIKKELDTTEEVVAILDSNEIAKIDNMYVPKAARRIANREKINAVLSERTPNIDEAVVAGQIKQSLAEMGDMRSFIPSDVGDETWKEVFKDFEWEVDVEITDETIDKEATLTTLTTLYQIAQASGNVAAADFILKKTLEQTGVVSNVELPPTPPPQPQSAPQQLPAQVGSV